MSIPIHSLPLVLDGMIQRIWCNNRKILRCSGSARRGIVLNMSSQLPQDPLISDFLESQRKIRDLSEHTLVAYAHDLAQLQEFLDSTHTKLQDGTREVV